MPGDPGLHLWSHLAERGVSAGAAEHRDKNPWRGWAEALDMASQLIDPDRDLVAEGRRHSVLAVRAPGDRHLGAALGKHGRGVERVSDELQENAVRLAQHQQIASLGDVLCRRAPVHPAAMLLTGDTRQFPYQRYDRVPGARK